LRNPKRRKKDKMKRPALFGRYFALMVLPVVLQITTGCATPGKPRHLNCPAEVEWQVAPEGRITRFDCKAGTHSDKPALIFWAEIENISSESHRFRLNIYLLDENLAGGRSIPADRGSKLDPGQTATITVPVFNGSDPDQQVFVILKTFE
jgi:hypothetical protein